MKISINILLILTINSSTVLGQIFSSDQAPPSVKWMTIASEKFQIAYPESFASKAGRVLSLLDSASLRYSRAGLGTHSPITVILDNQGVVSNGNVQLGPRRSEFYTSPPQRFDKQDWLTGLAIHEVRHVIQLDRLSGKLKKPLFEKLALAIFGVNLPPWFFEGDAVAAETNLSAAGRGKLPEWSLFLRANELSDRRYSYSKNYLGSYKDRTPGYYQLGYHMVSHLQENYGIRSTDSLLSRIASRPFRPYNFTRSLKEFTGIIPSDLHHATLEKLKKNWLAESEDRIRQEYSLIPQRVKCIAADYLFPAEYKGATVALKRSYDNTPEIVILTADKEYKMISIGPQTEPNLQLSKNAVVWDEIRYDKRYGKRSYSVINTFDLEQREYRQLTHNTRLFSPTLSPNADRIAAVKLGVDNKAFIVELDAETGGEIRAFPAPANVMLQTPSYNPEGTKIISVGVNNRGCALLEFDIESGAINYILNFHLQQLIRPVYSKDGIIFRADYNGINNLYLMKDSSIRRITNSRLGSGNPSYIAGDDILLFNDFQTDGYRIGRLDMPAALAAGAHVERAKYITVEPEEETSAGSTHHVQPKPYSRLFYFHSISPVTNDSGNGNAFGLQIESDNMLNTFELRSGYLYNGDLRKGEYFVTASYKGLLPIFSAEYRSRPDLQYYSDPAMPGQARRLEWREDYARISARVPLIFNRLNKFTSLDFSASTSYTSRHSLSEQRAGFIQRISFPMKYQLAFARSYTRAVRDIAPRWGQIASVSYEHLPFDARLKGDRLELRSQFYLPGLWKHHSLQMSLNYQSGGGIFRFSNGIPRISGYGQYGQVGPLHNTFLVDYRFPLAYPDLELGPVAYIKRIKGGLFTDFANLGYTGNRRATSYGFELAADFHFLRFFPEFELTGRMIFSPTSSARQGYVEFGFNYRY